MHSISVMQEMGLLEVKHGLLQVAETLDFIHNNAHLIHRAISPEVVIVDFFFCALACSAELKDCTEFFLN